MPTEHFLLGTMSETEVSLEAVEPGVGAQYGIEIGRPAFLS
jgi:hypothetical protein